MTKCSDTVSVVIPCYNASRWIRETLDSVLNQTYPVLEILVIDDGSNDDSAEIADSYGPPVRVIRQANQGESVARNRGIDEAKGNWIAFLDADDIWDCEKIAEQLNLAGPGVMAIHTDFRFFGAQSEASNFAKVPAEIRYSLRHMAIGNGLLPSSLMIRSDAKSRFPYWTQWGEDLIFSLEVAAEGQIALAGKVLTGNRRHNSNQSGNPLALAQWAHSVEVWCNRNHTISHADRIYVARSWNRKIAGQLWALLLNARWVTVCKVLQFRGFDIRLIGSFMAYPLRSLLKKTAPLYSILRIQLGKYRRRLFRH